MSSVALRSQDFLDLRPSEFLEDLIGSRERVADVSTDDSDSSRGRVRETEKNGERSAG